MPIIVDVATCILEVGVATGVVVEVGVVVDVATCVLEVGVVTGVVVAVGVNVDVATCALAVGDVTAVVVVVVVGVNVVAQRRCRSWRNRASRRSSESWAHNLSVGGRVTHRPIWGDAAVSLPRGCWR